MPAVYFANVIDAADLLMRHLTRNADLAMKASQCPAISQETIGKKLERDRLAQFEIVGAIDFAHAAFAQQANDPITLGQNCARHEARIVDGIERGG